MLKKWQVTKFDTKLFQLEYQIPNFGTKSLQPEHQFWCNIIHLHHQILHLGKR